MTEFEKKNPPFQVTAEVKAGLETLGRILIENRIRRVTIEVDSWNTAAKVEPISPAQGETAELDLFVDQPSKATRKTKRH